MPAFIAAAVPMGLAGILAVSSMNAAIAISGASRGVDRDQGCARARKDAKKMPDFAALKQVPGIFGKLRQKARCPEVFQAPGRTLCRYQSREAEGLAKAKDSRVL